MFGYVLKMIGGALFFSRLHGRKNTIIIINLNHQGSSCLMSQCKWSFILDGQSSIQFSISYIMLHYASYVSVTCPSEHRKRAPCSKTRRVWMGWHTYVRKRHEHGDVGRPNLWLLLTVRRMMYANVSSTVLTMYRGSEFVLTRLASDVWVPVRHWYVIRTVPVCST